MDRITEEAEADRQLLRFLWESGVRPGARLAIEEVAPYAGTISVILDGRTVTMGLVAADKIWVYDPKEPGARAASGPGEARGRKAGAPSETRARQRPCRERQAKARRLSAMAVQALFALQNGFIGFERSGLFFGDRSGRARRDPGDAATWSAPATRIILFDTGFSPRAVPGLLRTDPLARFSDEDLLVHRLDALGLEPADVDMVVLSPPPLRPRGRRRPFQASELVVQQDEYAYAHYPATFFADFYYRKNFDLPGYRWRLPRRRRRARPRRHRAPERRPHAGPSVAPRRAARDRAR